MDWTQLPRSLVLVPVLVLPASAQEPSIATGSYSGGGLALPEGRVVPAPCPPSARHGLFGWRRRHADCKRHLQETVLGYPEEFNEWPLGAALYAHGRTAAANGAAARLILNHYDFVGDTTELNYRGQDKLAAIAAQLPTSFSPVIIERTPWAPAIAEARRSTIVTMLNEGPFPVPIERVVIAPTIARGLTGAEAVISDVNRLSSFDKGMPSSGAAVMMIPR